MSRYVDRLEEELLRAGYGRRARMRRLQRPAVIAPFAIAAVAIALVAVRPAVEPERESVAAPKTAPCSLGTAPSSAPVEPRLLELLGSLRNGPPAQQTAVDAACAEGTVVAGGPANEGASRWVAPGLGRGSVYLVPVTHWAPAIGEMTAAAKERFDLPGVCLKTVGGLEFDAAGQCFSVEQVADGDAVATTEVPTSGTAADQLADAGVDAAARSGSYVSLVVPDGVASVELRYGDGASVRAVAANNTVITHSTLPAPQAMPTSVVWYDANGRACSGACEA
jgi:hypothetical protein